MTSDVWCQICYLWPEGLRTFVGKYDAFHILTTEFRFLIESPLPWTWCIAFILAYKIKNRDNMWRNREIIRFTQYLLYEKSKFSVYKMSPCNRNVPVHFVPFVLRITKIDYHQDKYHSETQKTRKILLFRMWTVFISRRYEYFCSGLVWCVQTLQWGLWPLHSI